MGYLSVKYAAAAKSLQSCLTLCDPIDGSPPGFPSLGFSRQEHWSGLPFPSPICMKVKSQSEVAQSCLTLSDPMDCSLPGSSVHGIFQARVLEWGAGLFKFELELWYHSHSNNRKCYKAVNLKSGRKSTSEVDIVTLWQLLLGNKRESNMLGKWELRKVRRENCDGWHSCEVLK